MNINDAVDHIYTAITEIEHLTSSEIANGISSIEFNKDQWEDIYNKVYDSLMYYELFMYDEYSYLCDTSRFNKLYEIISIKVHGRIVEYNDGLF